MMAELDSRSESEPEGEIWADYFLGGVPAPTIFNMDVRGLREALQQITPQQSDFSRAEEAFFITLVAYFEAFAKNHFASLISIYPPLLNHLKQAKPPYDTSVDATDILIYRGDIEHRLGFLVTEGLNFGTAKEINRHYGCLLAVTPFSKDDKRKYDNLLNDRNLLVHHGGIYTLRDARQRFGQAAVANNAFWQSVSVDPDTFYAAANFLQEVASKVQHATHRRLSEVIEESGVHLTDERRKALAYLLWD